MYATYMDSLHAVLVWNVVLHGLMAGISYELALIKLTAHKHVGEAAFADFHRATEHGRGFWLRLAIIVPGILLSIGTAIFALATEPSSISGRLTIAAGAMTLLYVACAGMTLPLALALKKMSNTHPDLSVLLHRLIKWMRIRAVLQFATFLLFVEALLL